MSSSQQQQQQLGRKDNNNNNNTGGGGFVCLTCGGTESYQDDSSGALVCTAAQLTARYGLAEQVYQFNSNAKNIVSVGSGPGEGRGCKNPQFVLT